MKVADGLQDILGQVIDFERSKIRPVEVIGAIQLATG
jgi:hypothetical protein